MSQNKITLKIAVRPLKGDSWKATCNAYPSIVGEGGDCDEALNSIVDKINEEFKSGTFKLDSGLKPAVSCKITEMKAVVTLGTENYTLSDFAAAPAADQEAAPAAASEFKLPQVPDISLQAGCDICKKYASGDCGGNSSNTSCGDYKPFRYAGEHCGTCNSCTDDATHCTQYDAATYAEHNACTSYRPKEEAQAQAQAPEAA